MVSVLDKVRESAKFVAENNSVVKINEGAIDKFLEALPEAEFKEKVAPVIFPLKFDNPEQEVNFLSLINLLNFGSGFRQELHHAIDKGAYETICFGAFAMYLSNGGKLDATFMRDVSIVDIGSYFNLPLNKEVALQPGLYTYQPSPLKPLADKIKSALNETGTILLSSGYSSLGAYIMNITKPQPVINSVPDAPAKASQLVNALVEKFPAFADIHKYQGKDIFVLKKAQILVADVHRRFKTELPNHFDFIDADRLTVFSDNVIPAVLRKYGILEFSPELQEHVDSKKEMDNIEWELILRTTAIHASELIVQKTSNLQFNAMELDYYLWSKGKDPDFRTVERHYTKNTLFY